MLIRACNSSCMCFVCLCMSICICVFTHKCADLHNSNIVRHMEELLLMLFRIRRCLYFKHEIGENQRLGVIIYTLFCLSITILHTGQGMKFVSRCLSQDCSYDGAMISDEDAGLYSTYSKNPIAISLLIVAMFRLSKPSICIPPSIVREQRELTLHCCIKFCYC